MRSRSDVQGPERFHTVCIRQLKRLSQPIDPPLRSLSPDWMRLIHGGTAYLIVRIQDRRVEVIERFVILIMAVVRRLFSNCISIYIRNSSIWPISWIPGMVHRGRRWNRLPSGCRIHRNLSTKRSTHQSVRESEFLYSFI